MYISDLFSSCRHPNIVTFYGLVQPESFIVMEFVEKGSLDSFLDEYQEELDPHELLWMCIHGARGMEYLSDEKHIIHNDLAARNLLVCTNTKSNQGKYLAKIAGLYINFH